MNARPPIPDEVLARQREASDPAVSAWVSANAGAGKTYVLAQRVIRLLLGGTDPAKILCLTFTKAAAANMATTVFDTLARWTALDDSALDDAIRAMSNERPSVAMRAHARRLFTLALETPGGLKVKTIHAFCTRLLQQFPFEANVAARFAVLEDVERTQLLERLSLDVLLQAAAQPEGTLGRALAVAVSFASDMLFRLVLTEAIRERDAVMGWIDRAGGVDEAIAELTQILGIQPDETVETIDAEIFSASLIPAFEWNAVADTLAEGLKTDVEKATLFKSLATLAGDERREAYLDIFCTDKRGPLKAIVTKAIRDNHPALLQRLLAEQQRLCALIARRRAVVTRDKTRALITIAAAVIERYKSEKERRGLLDYDDLIDKALVMLTTVQPSWVHYKLDLGIDHVLIDEAQDTSPKQWEVIERLVSEFAAGAGARGGLKRSIFAVGDDKQSIFSFQGAAPEAFAEKRTGFKRAYDAGGMTFRPIEFKYSFRSVQVVLDAVDKVFRQPAALRELNAEAVPTAHTAVRAQAPGLVEIWPLIEPDGKAQVEGWDAPFDTTSETSPRVKLARRIAACVRTWIKRGDRVGDGEKRHAVTPGDILILVRQRGPLFEAVIRSLKNAGVPVAGADRLVLTEHIAVMDLLALADALLLPDDDLALATILKSPLFGLDEEQLFSLASGRRGSLLSALRAKVDDGVVFKDAAARFDRLTEAAKRETPFAFFARVLGRERGRAGFLARLGPEAGDALDEFLNLALSYEHRETPSLQGFVAWLRTANAEVKRDMEINRNEVRVMTVHGAKGLEAPIVIVADTTTLPAGSHPPRLLALPRAGAAPGAPPPLVWAGRKDDDVGIVASARAAAIDANENEYRRLLYVAMTRAADRLIVCGAVGERAKPPGCWYDLMCSALVPDAAEEDADDGDGKVWRFRITSLEDAPAAGTAAVVSRRDTVPDWLDRNAAPEAPAPTPLTPSSAFDEKVLIRTATGMERKKALARGTLVHRLLQALPELPLDVRREAAGRHLARAGGEFSAEEQGSMLDQIFKVLNDPQFSQLFAPGSRGEVPIVGRLTRDGRTVAVSGQVDRLVVTAESVLIVDYKTNQPPPPNLPDAYVAQLALYRAVLAELYPAIPVRAALVWTDGPALVEVSSGAMDRALDRLPAG